MKIVKNTHETSLNTPEMINELEAECTELEAENADIIMDGDEGGILEKMFTYFWDYNIDSSVFRHINRCTTKGVSFSI